MEYIDVTIAFKKVTKDSELLPKIIGKFTDSDYYHVELIVNDVWVSVFPETGVRLNKLRPLSDNWDYKKIGKVKLTKEQHSIFWNYLYKQEFKKYDNLGIVLSQIIPLKINHKDKWFCSELVTKLLQMLYVLKVLDLVPELTSPGDLGKIFIKG